MFRYLRNVQHTAMRAALLSLISLGTGSAETAGAVVLLLGRRSSDCGHGAPALYLAMELTTECIHAHVKVEQPVLNARTPHVSTTLTARANHPTPMHTHTRGRGRVPAPSTYRVIQRLASLLDDVLDTRRHSRA